MYLEYLTATNSIFRYKYLYTERLKAIRFFYDRDGFDLFGTRWNNFGLLKNEDIPIIKTLNPHAVEDKILTLSNYKFSLCFENCTFPGYVTEKIFDCFFAGCIPIYWGAPDVADYIPSEAYIDYRRFKDYSELGMFLVTMAQREAQKYLISASDFLLSLKIEKFTDNYLAKKIVGIVENESKQNI